jgi:hypothetical protein
MRLTSTPNPDDRKQRLEPLPGDFSPRLQSIDERLSEVARQGSVPLGLSQRIFAASVERLPAQVRNERGLRFVDRVWSNRTAWGQFAMAASVAVAFGVAFWFVQGPHTKPVENIAHHNAEPDVSLAAMLRHLPSGQSHLEHDFDYLLETREMTSPDPITSELVMLVRELEM